MTRVAWDELVASVINENEDGDYDAILWADRVVKLAARAVLLHGHASIYCTQCFVDALAVKELRDALEEK